MPVPDLIRDSFVGQLIYYGSGRRYFRYPEDRPEFLLPVRYTEAYRARHAATIPPPFQANGDSNETSRPASVVRQENKDNASNKQRFSVIEGTAEGEAEGTAENEDERPQESTLAHEYLHSPPIHDVEKAKFIAEEHARLEAAHLNPNIVEWYGPDDPECPLNWSLFKRCFVTFDICVITFAIYIGSALFAPGIPDMAEKFGISQVAATLGLTMFVIGYGVGPMFLSPLSEIPQFGRAPRWPRISAQSVLSVSSQASLARRRSPLVARR
ncbi:hypothetical protein NM688_g7929 [Phlebia brevispora]|uniref:Uncharacterized protein n=1 Tax=Phlebia brevispora TaxID=194682 RepID=A0ACC1RZP5_9APHY|nr:hypothetical protein NM688_g7929 [Phlebia brevispora]